MKWLLPLIAHPKTIDAWFSYQAAIERRAMKMHNESRNELLEQRSTLITYLKAKLSAEDWHGVMDAAADIREIDAKLSIMKD